MSDQSRMILSETHTTAVTWDFHVDDILFYGKTPYQEVHVVNIPRFGKTCFLDLKIQSSALDEFIFHDGMVAPAMHTHPNPKKVLVAGGGEGATLRDVLKHNTVEAATMIDIDEQFVNICAEHLPEWSDGAFTDKRTTLLHTDARKWIETNDQKFDVFLSDLTDPLEAGPAVYLFTKEFFQLAYDCLEDDGIFAMQAGCANNNYPALFLSLQRTLAEVFPIVRPYWAFVTTFMMPWGYILASKKHDPLDLFPSDIARRQKERNVITKYYSHTMHNAMFCLPPLFDDMREKEAQLLTDESPFIWTA